MRRKKVIFTGVIAATVVFISLFFVQVTTAKENSVAEEILKILYDSGQINIEQYHNLLEKARNEEQRRSKQVLKKAREEREEEKVLAEKKIPPGTMTAYWKNGLHFDSKDNKFKLQIGGRITLDSGYIDAEKDVRNLSYLDEHRHFGGGTKMRQGRIYLKGTLYDRLNYMVQYDFAGGDADFCDVWFGLKDIPYLGNIKIGHFKEPFSLEELTSRKFITFMERSLPGEAGRSFVPARNTGIMFYNTALNERMTWALGGFRESDNYGNDFGENETHNLTARITGLPIYKDNGRKLLHLGMGYSHKWVDNDGTIRLRALPESALTTDFVDTGEIEADNANLFGPEIAMVYGPFSLQGEYFHEIIDTEHGSSLDYNGYYVTASYFLTGENRKYKKSSGAFDRIKLNKNFNPKTGGWGAWEVALRYSSIDLDDEDIDGGELEDLTVGLNWYLYPNLRMYFNYIRADLDDVGDTNIFQSRFLIDF